MKIAVFGDSISEGIGKRKINYCAFLEAMFVSKFHNIEMLNFSHTGTTINYILEEKFFDCSRAHYDVVIIGYGNVDAMLRPSQKGKLNLYKHLPNRYKKNGMLNPRPYYSEKWYKSFFQHVDSWIRWNLNKFLLAVQGRTTWVSEDEFKENYELVIKKVMNCADSIILLSTVQVSEKYFPGTNQMYIKYNNIIQDISKKYPNIKYVDLFNNLSGKECFYEDMFHPSEKGYEHIANMIYDSIFAK